MMKKLRGMMGDNHSPFNNSENGTKSFVKILTNTSSSVIIEQTVPK